MGIEQHTQDIFFKSRNKRLQCYVDGQNLFDQPVKSDIRTYDKMWKIAAGQGDDYTTGSLLNCPYFKSIIRW